MARAPMESAAGNRRSTFLTACVTCHGTRGRCAACGTAYRYMAPVACIGRSCADAAIVCRCGATLTSAARTAVAHMDEVAMMSTAAAPLQPLAP